MKIIKIIFLGLLALGLIACTGIFIFLQTFDTDQYLLQITKKASLAIGRPVSIGHLGLGLSLRGISLDVGPVTVADDPDFTAQPFIKIDRIRISLDLKSLILQHKIHIANILLQSPQIHFIRSQQGDINIRSLGQISRSNANDITTVKRPNAIDDAQFSSNIPATSDHRGQRTINITIQDGSVSFIDQNQSFPIDIWLTDIGASLKDFSLVNPFQLSVDACFYSNVPNVHASSLLSLDQSKRTLQISDLRLNMDFSRLDMDRLKDVSPEMPDSPIFKNIKGIVQLNMANLGMEPSSGLTANGDVSLTGGIIKNFNIIKVLLSHTLGAFGGMEGKIDNLLNGQWKDTLGADDTVIENARAEFSLHNKAISIDDSLIQTNIFELTAKGSVDQGLNVDMQTMLHLNNDVSATLVNELGGLQYLMDDSKRIAIGASLNGVFPHLKYKPNKDFRKKSKKFLMQEGGNILGILLGGGQTMPGVPDDSSEDQGKKHKKNFKNIFKSFLQ